MLQSFTNYRHFKPVLPERFAAPSNTKSKSTRNRLKATGITAPGKAFRRNGETPLLRKPPARVRTRQAQQKKNRGKDEISIAHQNHPGFSTRAFSTLTSLFKFFARINPVFSFTLGISQC
jgi:hypothetical protein